MTVTAPQAAIPPAMKPPNVVDIVPSGRVSDGSGVRARRVKEM